MESIELINYFILFNFISDLMVHFAQGYYS